MLFSIAGSLQLRQSWPWSYSGMCVFPGHSWRRHQIGGCGGDQEGHDHDREVAYILGAPDRLLEVNDKEVFHYYNYDPKSGILSSHQHQFFTRVVKSDDLFVSSP